MSASACTDYVGLYYTDQNPDPECAPVFHGNFSSPTIAEPHMDTLKGSFKKYNSFYITLHNYSGKWHIWIQASGRQH